MITPTATASALKPNMTLQKSLLVSGIMASLLYIAMNVFIPLRYVGRET